MMWLPSVGVTILLLWSFSMKVSRLERLRFATIGSQLSFLVLSLLQMSDFFTSQMLFTVLSVCSFIVFCFSYQKNCNRHDNNTIRFLILFFIMCTGVFLSLVIRPISILPLVLSCLVFHLHHEAVSHFLLQQSFEVRAMKDHIQALQGRIQRCGRVYEEHDKKPFAS